MTDGQPITSAKVTLQPIGASGWTDTEGRFVVGPVPEGNYNLRVEAGGFEPTEWAGFVVSPSSAEAILSLSPAQSQLGEVVVSTSRYSIDRSGATGAVRIDGGMLAVQPVIGEDALRTLARLPGIAQNGVSAQSSVRGGEAADVLTLLDGFPLRQAFHMPGYQSVFGVIDPGLVDEAEVYTGGFPVRYGNRMAGVFDLGTIDATSEPGTALGLSVFNAMARNGGKLEGTPVSWLGAARVGTLRPFIEAFGDGATSPRYTDVYARAGFDAPDGTRVQREPVVDARRAHDRTRRTW